MKPSESAIEFGLRIKALREARGLNRREMSDNIGISYTTLQGYETGEREPGHSALMKLADFYGVKVDYLLGREEISPASDNQTGPITQNLVSMLTQLTPEETIKIQAYIQGLIDAR